MHSLLSKDKPFENFAESPKMASSKVPKDSHGQVFVRRLSDSDLGKEVETIADVQLKNHLHPKNIGEDDSHRSSPQDLSHHGINTP